MNCPYFHKYYTPIADPWTGKSLRALFPLKNIITFKAQRGTGASYGRFK